MLALITGGLSKLGSVIAARLAVEGYDLALHVRTGGEPERALAETAARMGRSVATFPAELHRTEAVEDLVGKVSHHFGTAPTCLVNSASMLSEGGWNEVALDSLVEHFTVNTAVPIALTGAMAKALGPEQRGSVINLLDQRILNPPADQAAYTLSKLALAAATRAMARAFAPLLRVNGVAPGLSIPGPEYSPHQPAALAELMPLRALPSAEQVADAVAYLARAQTVTGQILFVDGGASLESFPRDFIHMGR